MVDTMYFEPLFFHCSFIVLSFLWENSGKTMGEQWWNSGGFWKEDGGGWRVFPAAGRRGVNFVKNVLKTAVFASPFLLKKSPKEQKFCVKIFL